MQVSAWLYLAQQLLSSFCLLTAIGISAGRPQRAPLRTLLLCVPLSLMSMAGHSLPPALRLALLPAAALFPLAAWPDAPRRLRLHMAALGMTSPLALTGLMRLTASLGIPWLPCAALSCGGLMLLGRADRHAAPLPRCTTVEISLRRQRATLTALVDSGNLLQDAVTGLPVIVISRRAAQRITVLPPDGTLLPGMRLLPVRTVSGMALMTVLRPDRVRIRVGSAWRSAEALIGLSPSGGEGFQALVPSHLLEDAADALADLTQRAGHM